MSGTTLFARALCVALLAGVTSGCAAGLGVGALATTGVSVAQERSTRQALTDLEIKVTLNNSLLNADRALFADVSTEVVEGRVLLTGSVPRPEQRIRAAQIAFETPDVKEVVNEITVANDAGIGSYAEDVWISTQLRGALLGDTHVSSINYNVETVDQVVHLIGIARSEQELDRVVNHARSISGVKEVVSHVMTKYDERRAGA